MNKISDILSDLPPVFAVALCLNPTNSHIFLTVTLTAFLVQPILELPSKLFVTESFLPPYKPWSPEIYKNLSGVVLVPLLSIPIKIAKSPDPTVPIFPSGHSNMLSKKLESNWKTPLFTELLRSADLE